MAVVAKDSEEKNLDRTHLDLIKLLQDELIRDAVQHLEDWKLLFRDAPFADPKGISKRSPFSQSDGVSQGALSKPEGVPQG